MSVPTIIAAGVSASVIDLVGDTPLIRLRRIERDLPGVELYAKAEWTNPGGSVKQMHDQSPGRYFYADQYNNHFNWQSHYDTTGPEIIRQVGPRLTHFVAGLGTSGTFMGTGRRLREFNPGVVLASVQPDSPLHGLEGLKHMESALVPGIYDRALADEDVRVGTEEAYEMTRRLAQEEGLLVGISSGANLAGALVGGTN